MDDPLPHDAPVWAPPIAPAAPRGLCTDCGISRTAEPEALRARLPVHQARLCRPGSAGPRPRPRPGAAPTSCISARSAACCAPSSSPPRPGAQWTGIATRIGERLLETGAVDAVLAMAPDPADRWRPVPVLVTEPAGMAQCRGMRMGYAPLLALLEPARARGYRRLAVIGIPCQVYALRALEAELGLERLYVVGTPCSDNTTTERFHQFLALLADDPATHHLSRVPRRLPRRAALRRRPPARSSPSSTCRSPSCRPTSSRSPAAPASTTPTCWPTSPSATWAARAQQWLLVRNERGEELVSLLGAELRTAAPGSAGKRRGPVQGFLKNVERAAGGLPLRRMPDWLRPIVSWLMPRFGPRGLEFARARVEMKAVETVLHLRRERPRRLKAMIPSHVWRLVAPYGLKPEADETSERRES